jgi:hypothetical protein
MGDLPDADFWTASLRICSRHNFRLARQPSRVLHCHCGFGDKWLGQSKVRRVKELTGGLFLLIEKVSYGVDHKVLDMLYL